MPRERESNSSPTLLFAVADIQAEFLNKAVISTTRGEYFLSLPAECAREENSARVEALSDAAKRFEFDCCLHCHSVRIFHDLLKAANGRGDSGVQV